MYEENKKPAGTKYLIEIETTKDIDIIRSSIGKSLYDKFEFEGEFKIVTVYFQTVDELKKTLIEKCTEVINRIG